MKCPYCKANIPAGADKCPNCKAGVEVKETKAEKSAPDKTAKSKESKRR